MHDALLPSRPRPLAQQWEQARGQHCVSLDGPPQSLWRFRVKPWPIAAAAARGDQSYHHRAGVNTQWAIARLTIEVEAAAPKRKWAVSRTFTTEQKIAILLKAERPGETISSVLRAHGISTSVLFR